MVLCKFAVPSHHIHDTITTHTHYIRYSLHHVSIPTNIWHNIQTHHTHIITQSLHNIFNNTINPWHDVSVTSYTLSHHISITFCEHCNINASRVVQWHHCSVYPLHHIPITWKTNPLHHSTTCAIVPHSYYTVYSIVLIYVISVWCLKHVVCWIYSVIYTCCNDHMM